MVRWSPRRARLVLGWATVSICYLPSRPTQPSILTGSVIEEWRICKWVTEVGQVREGDVTAAHDIQCVLSAGSRPLKLRSLLPHRADCVRVYSHTRDLCLSFKLLTVIQATEQWRDRLNACVKAKGKHFEHLL